MARRLTVAQLVPYLDGGGVERGTAEVAAALVARGHRSIVVSGGGRMVPGLERSGTEHVPLDVGRKSPSALALVPRLRALWRERAIDVVHARSRLPAWLAWLAWRGLAPPGRPRFVTTVHGLHRVNAYSAVMTRGERVVAVSETVRAYLREHYRALEPERIVLIPRGVDPAQFPYGWRPSPEWRREFELRFPETAGRPLVMLAGRLTRLKGHRDLFAVLERLRARGVDAHGLVVGGAEPGRGARHARRLAAEVRARDLPVTFTGHRDDVRALYAHARVVVSLSRRPESFGRAVLEALSLGVPVVGYAHGGVGEVLRAVFPAGAVALGDVGAAAERVERFLRDSPRVAPSDAYPLERMLERTVALYETLAGEAPGSPRTAP